MRKSLIVLGFIFLSCIAFAQQKVKEEKVKKGWNFGLLPAVSFDTDLGFQYGALVNFFNYGDGSMFPGYKQSLYFEASRFTKGSGIYRFNYDSEYLIPGIQVSADLSYLPDEAKDFYGFNGFESVINTKWEDDQNVDYRTRLFYKNKTNNFRFKADFQIPISGKQLRAIVGFNMLQYNISSLDLEKLNKGKSDDKILPDTASLYDKYVQWGLISSKEANGGFVPLLKAGIVYDTRDNKPNPMKGMWSEAVIFGAPKFLGAESSFLKFNITHRQYFTLIEKNLSFAYRLSYQTTIGGKTPFYYQPEIETSILKGASSQGLGGAKTIRGIRRNRVVGDAFVYGNTELRWKPIHFNFINQQFYIGLNGFVDFGKVVKNIDIESKVMSIKSTTDPTFVEADYFNFGAEKFHIGYGGGLRIVMNQNFIIAVDYGRSADKQDGESGLYIGLNYLF